MEAVRLWSGGLEGRSCQSAGRSGLDRLIGPVSSAPDKRRHHAQHRKDQGIIVRLRKDRLDDQPVDHCDDERNEKADRNKVVWGNRVSVSVRVGGWRYIKNKKT